RRAWGEAARDASRGNSQFDSFPCLIRRTGGLLRRPTRGRDSDADTSPNRVFEDSYPRAKPAIGAAKRRASTLTSVYSVPPFLSVKPLLRPSLFPHRMPTCPVTLACSFGAS